MEDFVNTIKTNIEKEECQIGLRSTKIKKLICQILSSDSQIKITEECNDNGDIKFEVSTRSLGLNTESIFKYEKELNTEFMANFLGEIFIREHIDRFVKILTKIKLDYLCKVNKFQHKKFGMSIYSEKIVFIFHASLLQNILTENLKKNLG